MKKNHILENNTGITLIALIVTIIVLLILAGVSISAIWGGEGIFSRTTEVAFKTELAKIKEEYEIYVADKMLENTNFQRETVSAYVTSLYYNTMLKDEVGNIYTVLKNSKREEVGKFEITKGELYYTSPDEKERKWAQDLGIKLNPYIVKDGVLLSSDANLGLIGDNTGTLVIPETVGGKTVTAIGAGAFGITDGIKKIVIPPTVTTIRENAFYNNTSLEEIEFQTKEVDGVLVGVKSIGINAFRRCTNLLKVEMPDTVTSMRNNAFRDCYKLKSMKLSNNIKAIQNQTFQDCSALESIIIPDSVNSIEENSFGYCSKLEYAKMSINVASFAGAFTSCNKLKTIDVENNDNFNVVNGIILNKDNEIQYIQENAIVGDLITIPSGVKTIAKGLITSYATTVKRVKIPASLEAMDVEFFTSNIEDIEIEKENKKFKVDQGRIYSIDGTILYYVYKQGTTLAKNITSLVIEDNVKTIGTSAFVNCTSIQQLNIGKGVDNINLNWSWNGAMKKLSSVTIDNENNKFCAIDNIIYTKKENKVYKLVLVPNGVTDFKIQTGVKVIGTLAFYNRLIDTIMIPSGVEEIEDTAFRYSTVNKITIPNSIKTMGANALRDCPNLKRVEIDKKENELKDPQNNCWGAGAGARVVHWLQ